MFVVYYTVNLPCFPNSTSMISPHQSTSKIYSFLVLFYKANEPNRVSCVWRDSIMELGGASADVSFGNPMPTEFPQPRHVFDEAIHTCRSIQHKVISFYPGLDERNTPVTRWWNLKSNSYFFVMHFFWIRYVSLKYINMKKSYDKADVKFLFYKNFNFEIKLKPIIR